MNQDSAPPFTSQSDQEQHLLRSAHDIRLERLTRLLFALVILLLLFTFSGANTLFMAMRLLWTSPILLGIALASCHLTNRLSELKNLNRYRPLPSLFFALCVAILLFSLTKFYKLSPFSENINLAIEAGFIRLQAFESERILVIALVLVPAWALFTRGFLSVRWGSVSVILLEAIVIGIGLQWLFAFIAVPMISLLGVWLDRRFGLLTSLSYYVLSFCFYILMLKIGTP